MFLLFLLLMLCVNVEMKMHADALCAMLTAEFLLCPFSTVLL